MSFKAVFNSSNLLGRVTISIFVIFFIPLQVYPFTPYGESYTRSPPFCYVTVLHEQDIEGTTFIIHILQINTLQSLLHVATFTVFGNIKTDNFFIGIHAEGRKETDDLVQDDRTYDGKPIGNKRRNDLCKQQMGIAIKRPLAPSGLMSTVAQRPVAIEPQVPPTPWMPNASRESS